jgi:hypothetical protein
VLATRARPSCESVLKRNPCRILYGPFLWLSIVENPIVVMWQTHAASPWIFTQNILHHPLKREIISQPLSLPKFKSMSFGERDYHFHLTIYCNWIARLVLFHSSDFLWTFFFPVTYILSRRKPIYFLLNLVSCFLFLFSFFSGMIVGHVVCSDSPHFALLLLQERVSGQQRHPACSLQVQLLHFVRALLGLDL